jgi:putative ABC transport system substrate-binding protein
VTRGTQATLAAARLPGEVPVVASAIADPDEVGLVANLDAPGGKVTGLASNAAELGPKRMELLKALAPGMTRIGVLVNPDNPGSLASWKAMEAAAPGLRLKAAMVDSRKRDALPAAIEAAAHDGVDGLVVGIATLTAAEQARVIEITALHRLPTIYADRQAVDAGGLASYGAAYGNLYYRAAGYVDKLLKGARAAELAMGRPTKFEFVINRRSARALGLAIPPDLLLRSDDVVESRPGTPVAAPPGSKRRPHGSENGEGAAASVARAREMRRQGLRDGAQVRAERGPEGGVAEIPRRDRAARPGPDRRADPDAARSGRADAGPQDRARHGRVARRRHGGGARRG